MGSDSKIEWTHHTFNPWWGCVRVSPGCEHCYAEAFAKRTGKAKWGAKEERRTFGDAHWTEPHKWNRAAEKAGERHRVFCASMADVFEDRDDLEPHRFRLLSLINQTPHLDWLLLTKRPQNILRLLPDYFDAGPVPNIWLGATVEDQKRADERIPHLLAVPATVRFLSCEPLLESIDLRLANLAIDWVIIGGESGPGARPFETSWARDIIRQCREAGAAPFVKQLGAHAVSQGLHTRLPLVNRKGGDMHEWADDLRVREFPGGAA